ncbi:hypothetical protein M8494_25610 [Serratia ureilytica]
MLTDHLVCELKAAQTGMWLIRRYVADKESGDALLALLRPANVSARSAGARRTRCFARASSPARSCRKTARPTARIWRIAWCC